MNRLLIEFNVVEADVNTATPSLSNAAATWAGWAVTAVTAKFYRSQSDTVKSINPIANRMLSKPASLGECIYNFETIEVRANVFLSYKNNLQAVASRRRLPASPR